MDANTGLQSMQPSPSPATQYWVCRRGKHIWLEPSASRPSFPAASGQPVTEVLMGHYSQAIAQKALDKIASNPKMGYVKGRPA